MTQDYDDISVMAMMAEEGERFDSMSDDSNDEWMKKFVMMPKEEGFVVVRILPPIKGHRIYTATRTHRLVKDKNQKKARNLHCPREITTTKQGKKIWVDTDPKNPCPICMYSRVVWAEVEAAGGKDAPGGKAPHAEYTRIKAIERYYYNCVVRVYNKKGDYERTEGPKILSIGVKLHEKIVRAFYGDKKAGPKGKSLGDISDINTGRDFTIVKKVDGDFPSYDESAFGDPCPLGTPEEVEEWLANRHDLRELRVLKPVEELDIALQKYTGALPDEEVAAFDISKYRKKAVTLGEQVEAEKKVVAKPVLAPAPTAVVKSADATLAEGDFLAGMEEDLNNMQ